MQILGIQTESSFERKIYGLNASLPAVNRRLKAMSSIRVLERSFLASVSPTSAEHRVPVQYQLCLTKPPRSWERLLRVSHDAFSHAPSGPLGFQEHRQKCQSQILESRWLLRCMVGADRKALTAIPHVVIVDLSAGHHRRKTHLLANSHHRSSPLPQLLPRKTHLPTFPSPQQQAIHRVHCTEPLLTKTFVNAIVYCQVKVH